MNQKYTLYFALIFLSTAFCNQYGTWLGLPPTSIHQWRQADGAALAHHYAQNPDFSQPEVFNLTHTGDAHAVGELPILYWMSGLISRYLGFPAFPLRWINLLLMVVGFWAFGWMLLKQTKHPLIAALGTGLLMTSPIVGYYGVSFLPDMPAFCFILMMGASLWQSEETQHEHWIFIAAIFAALGILLKISMAVVPIAIVLMWVLGNDKQIWSKESIWGKKAPITAILIVFIAVLMGRWWISDYNAQHHATYFFAAIRPIWNYSWTNISEILVRILGFGLPAYFSIGLFLAIFKSSILCKKNWQDLSFFWQKTLLLTVFGCFIYFILWFRMLKEHDYYWSCLLVFPAILLILGSRFALQNKVAQSVYTPLFFCWMLGLGHSSLSMNKRLQLADFPESALDLPTSAFLNSIPLDNFAIPKTARFICPEDPSPNTSLLALQRQGWSAYNFGDRITRDTLFKYITLHGLTHLALRDSAHYKAKYWQFFPKKEVFLNGWTIYSCDLGQFKQDSNLTVLSQNPARKICLKNPSFEDNPNCCCVPEDWLNVGLDNETPPDIQPGYFGVKDKPYQGKTYVGMVARDNNTTEAITQNLETPITINSSYEFSIGLAQSKGYFSVSKTTGGSVKYETPMTLTIWGSNVFGLKTELLAKSPQITNKDWQIFNFKLNPKENSYKYLTLEVTHEIPSTNGNILMDACSDLKLIPK
jgi:Dolichyl-phosphate-mannose-protein mannosyltransferase